jgi:hypothetical protein
MISPRLAKIVLWVASFVVLFPISARIADPLATYPWNPAIDTKVLLLWPDRIELRPMSTLAEFSPRPSNARCSFLVPPGRQKWVEECLRNYPLHTDASWIIRIKQTGPSKQRIQLEVMGDGFWGTVYEATTDRVVPLGTRLAGPGFAVVILGIQLAC